GIEFPYQCPVCGCGGDLGTNPETGKPMLVIDPENGRIRDRNNDKARAEHLNEIIQTRIGIFQQIDDDKPLMSKYRDMQIPTFTIER
ncbi:MAG: flavodoxin family protein, partial [Atopobiaceae bacterium]|nr:flavodoxin family protein [Atopobiaceae bacterium]